MACETGANKRGHCRPAAAAACDDGDPCTTDTCDEKTAACTHRVSGPVDQDGDGHYAIGAACGSSSKPADDCDDKNPNVYPGHPELCDEVDNNCDGLADDGVWSLGAVTALTKSGGYPIGNALGSETTPAVVAVGNGFDVIATGDGTTGEVQAFRMSAAAKLLGTATLATATGPDCPPTSGKRVAYPTAAGDGTSFLAGFVQGVIQANTCCQANAKWTRSALGVLAPGDLSDSTRLVFDDDIDVGCTTEAPTARISKPSAIWVPAVSRYVASWTDSHAGNQPHAWVASVSATGALGGAHTVTASESDSAVVNNVPQMIQLAASPTRVFVAFAAGATLRMVLLDPSSLSVVLGPVDLGNSFQTLPLAAAYSGGKFFLVHTTRGSFDISVLDATTLQELRTASIAVGSDALFSPRLVTVGSGVFLVFSRGATRLSYGFSPANVDSAKPELFALTDVDLGTSVSGAGIAALDDRHIAAAWVDGDVKTAILTCGQ